MAIDPTQVYTVTLTTDKGDIVLDLSFFLRKMATTMA